MKRKDPILPALVLLSAGAVYIGAQEVANRSITVDTYGRIQIQVASSPEFYYVLYRRRDPPEERAWAVSMKLGEEGTTTLTEPLGMHGPHELYRVVQHRRDDPTDTDGDGIDDIQEMLYPRQRSPLNPARAVPLRDGAVSIPDRATFQELSYQGLDVYLDSHLENLEFVKFYILEANTDHPELFFINTNTHRSHGRFAQSVGIEYGKRLGSTDGGVDPSQMRGEIVYHPYIATFNGETGMYRFEFQPSDVYPFAAVQMAHELLAANMPVLRNNLAYYPMPYAALSRYRQEKDLYDSSRIPILLEEDIYANAPYIPLNIAEGYGLLRLMDLQQRPMPRDIVLYEALPNEVPRVGGIITTVPQTPLSHVNLRAVQDKVPNAYIKDAVDNATISSLIGTYVHFKVDAQGYQIRAGTLDEVEAHYVNLRPTEPQIPIRDLSITHITPLDEIGFGQSSSFGVKTANLATLGTFGFPEGTIPDGFGIPFYFYDEFMKHNSFYELASALIADSAFQADFDVQEMRLSTFRKAIRKGDMPIWMWNALTTLQNAFPEGTSIRCRSSTNAEDLPGFSGAGLYTSKTQHPHEGHIAKSIRQVYAGLWNFRAFDERQFHRIDHLNTAMGILVHPNYTNEKANGVGVTTDPIYQTKNTYYLNTQVGEDLVTNPQAFSIPEEMLLAAIGPGQPDIGGFTVVRHSNQLSNSELILSETQLDELRAYLSIIHDEFRVLYNGDAVENFAMEIEYKLTEEDQLAIKQARPWGH